MAKFKIIVDPEACVGCGACTSVCDNLVMDDESGKAKPKQAEVDELGCNKDAQETCPVDAIKLRDKEDKYVPVEDTFAMYNAILNKKAEINRAKKIQQ